MVEPATPRPSAAETRDWMMIALLLAALACLPPIAGALDQPFLIRVGQRVVIFALAASALNLTLGFGGMISLMHAAFFGLGAYIVAIASFHEFNGEPLRLGPLAFAGTGHLALSLPLAIVIGAVVAAVLGAASLRTSGAYFIMITLAFNQMLFYYFVALQTYGGEDGLQILGSLDIAGLDPAKRAPYYYVCLGFLALVLIGLQRVVGSRFGMALRGAAQNERRVVAVGIPAFRYKLAAFAISGALVALAGGLMAGAEQFVSPAEMSWSRSGDLVVMCVLGGLNTVWGPVLGAAAFLILEFGLSNYTTHWQLPFGLIVIAVAASTREGAAAWARRLGLRA